MPSHACHAEVCQQLEHGNLWPDKKHHATGTRHQLLQTASTASRQRPGCTSSKLPPGSRAQMRGSGMGCQRPVSSQDPASRCRDWVLMALPLPQAAAAAARQRDSAACRAGRGAQPAVGLLQQQRRRAVPPADVAAWGQAGPGKAACKHTRPISPGLPAFLLGPAGCLSSAQWASRALPACRGHAAA